VPKIGHKAKRTCLGCRQEFDQEQLIRYVASPEGDVLVDYRQKLPGRGCYTCFSVDCVRAAAKRRQFGRAFRRPELAPLADDLLDALQAQLRDRILGLLGMARKSGNIISGSNLVLAALGGPAQPALVLLAEDVSDGIGDKVQGKAASVGVACFRFLTKADLGQQVGRDQRSTIGVKAGQLAEALRGELVRYRKIVGET
jgi:uncharacterized protein